MSDADAGAEEKEQVQQGELIDDLQEDPNYFALKYNELQQSIREKEALARQAEQNSTNNAAVQSRLG